MENDLKNLQREVLYLTQRVIKGENVQSGYDAFIAQFNARLELAEKNKQEVLNDLIDRVKKLESARKVQIELNSKFNAQFKPEIKVDTGNFINKLLEKFKK